MKKISILVALFLITFFNGVSQNWITNITKAKELATTQDKNIVLVFSGSDWCGTCIKLDKTVWQSPEFKSYADEHFIMLRVDFPKKKKNKLSDEQQAHNDLLAEKYHARFPWVVVLDADGNVLDKFGYIKDYTPQDYINRIEKFNI